MIGNTYSGDTIALEFLDIVNKLVSQKNPVAQATNQESGDDIVVESAVSEEELGDKSIENYASSIENYVEPPPESFIMENEAQDPGESRATMELESLVEDLQENEAEDQDSDALVAEANNNMPEIVNDKALRMLNGLGRIAGGLRRKGELFAADVVESTAMSIKGDFLKESSKKAGVVNELRKISSDLNNENKKFASDLVEATINKILKS